MTIRLFEVGGSIRDDMLGIKNPPDRDFCAESPRGWSALVSWCHENMKKVFLITPEFFTVRGQLHNGTSIDVVMCRKDGPSSNGRHPDHVIPGTLLDDLARRDFTVNAMAWEVDPKTLERFGSLIDPHDGEGDLDIMRLSCVGQTEDRLREDGLRLLRAVRFAVTKNLKLDADLKKAVNDCSIWNFMIKRVSIERVREELQKMFKHNTSDSLLFLAKRCHPATTKILFNSEHSTVWLKPTLERK